MWKSKRVNFPTVCQNSGAADHDKGNQQYNLITSLEMSYTCPLRWEIFTTFIELWVALGCFTFVTCEKITEKGSYLVNILKSFHVFL